MNPEYYRDCLNTFKELSKADDRTIEIIKRIPKNIPRAIRAAPPAKRKAYMWDKLMKIIKGEKNGK